MDALSGEKFDASQYAFFGSAVTGEIEIGGLDEDNDNDELKVSADTKDDFLLGGEGEEILESTLEAECEIESLASREIEPKAKRFEATKGLGQNSDSIDPSSWVDHVNEDFDLEQEVKKWSLNEQQKGNSGLLFDGNSGSSSHQAQQLPWWVVDPFSVQAAPAAPNHVHRNQQARSALNIGPVQILQAPEQGPGVPLRVPYRQQQYFNHQPAMGMSPVTPFGVNISPQFTSSGPIMTQVPATQWLPQPNVQLGSLPGSHSTLMPPQVALQYHRPHLPPQLHAPHSTTFPSHPKQPYLSHGTPPFSHVVPKIGEKTINGDMREHVLPKGRQTQRHHQHGMADGNFFGRISESNGWLPLQSKYMTVEEIENIVRIQWAATHSNDPYVDDYYHLAMQTKLATLSGHSRRHFAPSRLRELPSHTRAAVEPHPFLQVEALGRVPFSSIRRPRPLLEVESNVGQSVNSSGKKGDSLTDGVPQYRPLEQEPMLAARIAIEDGLCLLLDVNDIDRMLSSSQPPDGGAQLRWRRQLLLEALAASLQLLDTNGIDTTLRGTNRRAMRQPGKDNLVFLRLASLQKGRKFLARFVLLLTPGSELVWFVSVAMCQHLRFLFGGVLSDTSKSASTAALAIATAVSVSTLDLPALSACLVAVVLSPEQPPLRPLGNPAGDGATVVLRALLERATSLLTDRNAAYPIQNRAIWQTAFDAFFVLLSTYCTNKYESIFHSLMMASPANPALINSAAAVAMSKEMPIELLRASLPHTNEHQRKLLLEFTQRSIAMDSFSSNAVTDSYFNTSAV